MTTALIYTRVSQDRAEGRSVDEQEQDARAVCQREGWEVLEVVTDSVGASRHSKGTRTGWTKAEKAIASGSVDVLVTWEASRAQRDLAAYSQLRDLCASSGVRWSYSGRTYDLANADDRFATGLDALMAEREADQTATRVQRAIRANAMKGRPHGRRLFGYARVYDPQTGALMGQEPEPTEANTVREIFADYLGGMGIRTIAAKLNNNGITTGTGAKWMDSQVRRVLGNPAYAARRVHRGEVIGEADWPALVTPDQFERVQARIEAQQARNTRQTSTARLLTGVGRCGVCGSKMAALKDRNGRRFYGCRDKYCTARDMVKLDKFVGDVLVAWLGRPDMAQALSEAPADPASDAARETVAALRARLDEAVVEFTVGNLSAATLATVERTLTGQIAEAERQIRQGAIPLSIDVPAQDVAGWWAGLELSMQREVIGAAFAAVVILPVGTGTGRGDNFDPDGIRLEWRR